MKDRRTFFLRRASNRSFVFILDNVPTLSDVVRAGDRTRTGDILLGRQGLYQLSYARVLHLA
jgi:hypothetical protein